ncbi:MAG: manganese efflux pump MntP family protein [Gallionella sp.]|nr:manganese efflux pump MntP family protein [Gallionella sp.]MDD4946346.1 manganese efflux pump MntP family protein [Gallionella sp.]MDD5612621.1 manganese efflux pump MntP family protein [Gallionella sp.]
MVRIIAESDNRIKYKRMLMKPAEQSAIALQSTRPTGQSTQPHPSSTRYQMFEVMILAVALSMDAFAVSIGLGSKSASRGLGIQAGLYFGAFQALMPFIGYLGGRGVLGWVDAYAHWIACLLLSAVGAKMIYEGLHENIEEDIAAITNKLMLMLAVATSLDAMAAGFSLTLLDINVYLACALIGLTTFAFSWAGVGLGRHGGAYLEGKAEVFGGIVLILIGLKMLAI